MRTCVGDFTKPARYSMPLLLCEVPTTCSRYVSLSIAGSSRKQPKYRGVQRPERLRTSASASMTLANDDPSVVSIATSVCIITGLAFGGILVVVSSSFFFLKKMKI